MVVRLDRIPRTWATIPHILFRNKPPASTLAWIWAVILFPYGGTIFYFIFGTDRLVRQKLRATREMDASGGRAERRVNADTEASLEQLSANRAPRMWNCSHTS